MKKITGNEPINSFSYKEVDKVSHGLTIRQYYAGLAMQGLINSPNMFDNKSRHTSSEISTMAVIFADALIIELNKSNSE